MIKRYIFRYSKPILRWIRGEQNITSLINNGLQLGSNVNIQKGVFIDPSHCWHICIGNNVTLAPRCIILAHDASTKKHLGYTKIGKVRIGDNTFVGAGAIILPNVSIGNNCIIGAGSVISKNIPSNSVAVGNPAQVVFSTDIYLEKHQKKMKSSPVYGVEYTLNGDITDEMKKEMNNDIESFGYVI
jgi:maltose O-acetyltransferase